jgi:hypothetical protein
MSKFDQNKYIAEYNKKNYTSCSIKVKNEFMELLTEYSQNLNISKTALIQKCVQYCYDNYIDVSNVKLSTPEK